MTDRICYRPLHRYRYQLMEPFAHLTELRLPGDTGTGDAWVVMTAGGEIAFKKGYAWDGPSGPTIDSPNFMRGSLVHDGLYQLMRESLLGLEHRKYADKLLQRMCRRDGMSSFRAWYVHLGVRAFGGKHARPRPIPVPVYAP